eukprot:gene17600-19353_t
MVPSYGAGTAHAVLNAFYQSSNPILLSKTGSSLETADMLTNIHPTDNAFAKSKDNRSPSPVSQLNSCSVSPRVSTRHDSDNADMVFASSSSGSPTKHMTTEQLVFAANHTEEITHNDIFRPTRKTSASNNNNPHSTHNDKKSSSTSTKSLSNGTVSPKRNSRTNRESIASVNRDSHHAADTLGNSRSNGSSSSSALSPLPKLLESLSPAERASMTRPQIVAQEILVTERTYVRDLQDVIEGYLIHLLHHGMTDVDIETIFGNLEDIYDFNKSILEELEGIEEKRNPVMISQCFLKKAEGFNSLYVQYCTNYPESAAFLAEILKDKEIADFFLERQKALSHTLPIDSYLMKPVQRIMKYHLLFKDMAKHIELGTPGFDVVQTTAAAMADVAEYINEMKRLHENALRVEEILGSIEDLDGLDVFATGRLVLENTFRLHGSRGDKQLFLFEKLLLICKKLDEGNYQFRDGISCSNMMLVESFAKEPLCFQIIRFDNQKVTFTIQAKNIDIKRDWTKQLKRLIIENHTAMIPLTAREAILGPDKNLRQSKYNTIPLQALDEKIHWKRQKQNSFTGKENQQKDRGSLLIGGKRESLLKEESNSPKKSSLNTKAKDFLDKKDTKEKNKPWKLKRGKHRKTASSTSFETEVLPRQLASSSSDLVPPATVAPSRSLESLKDALSSSQENLIGASEAMEETPVAASGDSDEASQQIRRLSMLHDLISFDVKDPVESSDHVRREDAAEEKSSVKLKDETPRSIKALRRLHVSKSVYLDLPNDPLRPGDLRRSRPLSLPPVGRDDVMAVEQLDSSSRDEIHDVFEESEETRQRSCNDLRKYGLTRTRSLSRKGRGSNTNLAGSNSSVNAMMVDNEERMMSIVDADNKMEDLDQLEKRLSIISDDDKASTSIKNTLRKVSQAFSSHGSEVALDSISSHSASNSNLSFDLGGFMLQERDQSTSNYREDAKSKRRSLGCIISETINPMARLDETKKRAFSTTVINEVSMDMLDDDTLPDSSNTKLNEHHQDLPIAEISNESAMEESFKNVSDIINEYNEHVKTLEDHVAFNGSIRTRSASQVSSDSQLSSEGIFVRNDRSRLQPLDLDAQLSSISASTTAMLASNQVADASNKLIDAEQLENGKQVDADSCSVVLESIESTTTRDEELDVNSKVTAAVDADLIVPKRPAAPSSLNYVGSYAASVRRYRKKNIEVKKLKIKESKSVYDRIREYTALVSEEKSLQRGKSVEEMLETLDSVNEPVSNAYFEQRRKFASIASVPSYGERTGGGGGSVLGKPEVWFDTDSADEELAEKQKERKASLKPKKGVESGPKSPIDQTESKSIRNAFSTSRILFRDMEKERMMEATTNAPKTSISEVEVVVQNAVKNAREEYECNTIPRSKQMKTNAKRDVNKDVNKVNKETGSSRSKDWRKWKSHTIDKVLLKSQRADNNCDQTVSSIDNNNILSSKSFVDGCTEDQGEIESKLVVKDIVSEYQKCIIVPGEKEVEEMRNSNMRRSKKKRDKEMAKSNLQRKLSLRNLDEEEKEEPNKLSRSISCENVQRGTVKQLISLFNIRK